MGVFYRQSKPLQSIEANRILQRLARDGARGMRSAAQDHGGGMKRIGILLAAAVFVMSPVMAAAPAVDIAAAVAAPGRTSDNVKLDESRKPVEVLSFFGLKKGSRVIDMFGANRYWAEIMAPVVGPKGHVTVWQPTQFMNDERAKAFAEFAKRHKNVSLISSPFEAPELGTNAYD